MDSYLTSVGILTEGSSGKIAIGSDVAFGHDTFTAVASMSKLITIVCIMQLVENDIFQLDADVRTTLPELAKLQVLNGFDDNGQPIFTSTDEVITLR